LETVNDPVLMYHPDIKISALTPRAVPRQSFDLVWKAKGWRIWPPKVTRSKTTKEQ
jgi:hypothetical protein